MGQLQLQLNLVNVRLARSDRAGHDPAPVGTHVWLDIPGGRGGLDFVFQEFVVGVDLNDPAKRRLNPVGGSGVAHARIDQSETYWCVWSPPGQTLTVPNQKQMLQVDKQKNVEIITPLNRIPGFGWPLLATLNGQMELVLPNFRKLIVREFNLSGMPRSPFTDNTRQGAIEVYKDLHVNIDFQQQTPRAGQSNLFLFGPDDHRRSFKLADKDRSDLESLPAETLPLTESPYLDPNSDPIKHPNELKSILLVWVNDFRLRMPAGFMSDLVPAVTCFKSLCSPANLRFALLGGPNPCSVIFHSAIRTSAVSLAHELGHCLWSDPGRGKNFSRNFSGSDRSLYGARLSIMLANLKLGLFLGDIFQLLEADEHSDRGDNLMYSTATKAELTFLQVSIFRRAQELRWPGESRELTVR